MSMVVGVFLAYCLDGRAKIAPPFVSRCFFNLTEKQEATEWRIDDDAKVIQLSSLCIEGIVVLLDLGLEVELVVENLEGLGVRIIHCGVVHSLADGLQSSLAVQTLIDLKSEPSAVWRTGSAMRRPNVAVTILARASFTRVMNCTRVLRRSASSYA